MTPMTILSIAFALTILIVWVVETSVEITEFKHKDGKYIKVFYRSKRGLKHIFTARLDG